MPVVFSTRDREDESPEEPIMIIRRPRRSGCSPLCLQSVDVYAGRVSAGKLIGSVHQAVVNILPLWLILDLKVLIGILAEISW